MTPPKISFEFFPPKNLEASFRLWDTVQVLAPLEPRFISVIYGAGGTTRDLTRDAVSTLHKSSGLRVAAHLTCVNSSRQETLAVADSFAATGISDIIALRGDLPKGVTNFTPHPDGFQSSIELITVMAQSGTFTLRVAAYPEGHPEAESISADIAFLKRKIDAGASEALTQFFFEAETFLRFRDACDKAGIKVPITPGILPIENWQGTRRFAKACNANVPAWLSDAFSKAERDGREDLLATAVCTELCSQLLDEGVDMLHFYTLNRPDLTRGICHALGVTAPVNLEKIA